jgi:sugar phosphate isomerase/epimerase
MNPIVLAPTSLSSAAPVEFIDASAKAGYDGIGLRMFASPGVGYPVFHEIAGDAKLRAEVKSAMKDSGLKLYDALSYYMQPEMDFDAMLPSLELAAELGAGYALCIGDDPDWGRQVQNFATFCDHAAQYGLVASLEAPVSQRKVNTIEKAVALVTESGKQNAVICIDPFHYFRVGNKPEQLYGYDKRLFPYTQLDDGLDNEPAPRGRTAPGEGLVPLDDILDALTPDLPLSLEWGGARDGSHTSYTWAVQALADARKYLDGYYERKAAKK